MAHIKQTTSFCEVLELDKLLSPFVIVSCALLTYFHSDKVSSGSQNKHMQYVLEQDLQVHIDCHSVCDCSGCQTCH